MTSPATSRKVDPPTGSRCPAFRSTAPDVQCSAPARTWMRSNSNSGVRSTAPAPNFPPPAQGCWQAGSV
ncbi:hypothetical protein ZEAMMB73_Zm00001d021429 [Zea mays]|uniref:Uncharacterized protein n=1 Tax=Zea mays TaxID=4577 RepID=A0A1D6IAV0_MAIZE|nr:hypothetical protein ZEAMMB73_Zm00001d021429 [Zea mays]